MEDFEKEVIDNTELETESEGREETEAPVDESPTEAVNEDVVDDTTSEEVSPNETVETEVKEKESFIPGVATSDDEYSKGFNKEYYQYAKDLVEDEFSNFNYYKNEAKEAYDFAQEKLETAKERYENALDKYNEEQAEAKEWAEKFGFEAAVDADVPNPGTLEEYTQKFIDDVNKAKEEYSRYEEDSKVFQEYLDRYKEDWDKYQSTLVKEEPKEEKTSFDDAVEARMKAEQAATQYLFEKYGNEMMEHMPAGGWTVENCQEIVDAASKVSNLTEDDGKKILDAISKANKDVAAVTNDPEGVKRTEALTSADTTLADGTKITNISYAVGNGIGIQIESPNGNKIAVYAQESGTPNFWNFTVKERQPGSDAPETLYEKEHIATAVLQKEMSKQISEQINKNSSPVDPKLVELAKNVIAANEAMDEAEKADTDVRDEAHKEAVAMKKDAFEAYQNGEISAVEFANLMNEAKKIDTKIDLVYTPEARAAEEVSIPPHEEYEKLLKEFKYLNTFKDKVNAIEPEKATTENYETIRNDLTQTTQELVQSANDTFRGIAQSILDSGKSLQEVMNTEEVKGLSQELFELSQAIYDKTDALESKAVELGISEYADPGMMKEITTKVNAAWDSITQGKPLNENEAYAVMTTMDSIQGVKLAAEALMKSAAFNGAKNVEGGKAAEALKKEAAYDFTWKDWVSTAIFGGIGVVTTTIGIAAANPLLIAAGGYITMKEALKTSTKGAAAKSTKEEQMFGAENADVRNALLGYYNTLEERANTGDPRAVSTYTNPLSGSLGIVFGMSQIALGSMATGIATVKDGLDKIGTVATGGLKGNVKVLVNNVYELGQKISAWDETGQYQTFTLDNAYYIGSNEGGKESDAQYGVANTSNTNVDSKYSGYREQAKESNVATDYNRGLEKNVNTAVSDKIVKVFNSEPDYIKNAIRKILISYRELH